MKLLKIFTNALLAGTYGSFLYLLLVFYVNPGIELTAAGYFSLFPFLGIPYAAGTGILFTFCLLAVRPFWIGSLKPRWIGFRYTVWMLVVNLFLLALLYGASRWVYRHVLPPTLLRVLLISTAAVLGLALILMTAVLMRRRKTRKSRRLGISLGLVLGLFLLWWLRAAYPPHGEIPSGAQLPEGISTPGTFILGIGAASLDLVVPLMAEGKLPAISQIFRDGAAGRLRGFRPADPGALWASLSTGKYPFQHGRFGDSKYRILGSGLELDLLPWGFPRSALQFLGVLQTHPVDPASRKAKPFWEILGEFGEPITVGNWDAAGWINPVPEGSSMPVRRDAGGGNPTGWDDLADWQSVGLFTIEEAIEELSVPGGPLDEEIQEALQGELVEAIGEDLAVVRETRRILDTDPPRVLALRLRGLERISRFFLKYHRPEEFGNVPGENIARYGGVLEAYYRFLDDVCDQLRDRLPEGGRLFVVSPLGIEPMRFPERMMSRFKGRTLVSGSIRGAPDGLFLAVGEGIQAGVQLEAATLFDFLPTLLYSLELPVGRDLQGRTLTEIFQKEFVREHPVSLIPSYETAKVQPRRPE